MREALLERIRRHPRAAERTGVAALALAYGILCWSLNAGRSEMAFDDAVLELGLEAMTDRSSPHLEDPLFRNLERTDLYRHVIRITNRLTGDRFLSRRLLLAGLGILMVAGWYVLWKGLFGSTGLAMLGAVLSSLPRPSLGAEIWGALDTEHVLARSLYLPALPLVLLGFLRGLDRPRGAYWIAAPALLAPLHALSAFYLTGILALTYLFHHRLSRQSLAAATGICAGLLGAGLLVFLILTGGLPTYLALRPLSPGVDPREYWHALKVAHPWALYPTGFWAYNLREVLLHAAPLGLAAGALVFLRGSEGKPGVLGPRTAAIFGMVVIALTLLPPWLYEELCFSLGRQPSFLEYFRPCKFLYVVGFWALLEAARRLWVHPARPPCRILAGALILGALLPGILESRAVCERLGTDGSAARRRASFSELCAWAAGRTAPADRFCFGESAFRLRARRPILTSRMELMLVSVATGGERLLIERVRQVRTQEDGSAHRIRELARSTGCRYLVLDKERARKVPPGWLPRAYANADYEVFDVTGP